MSKKDKGYEPHDKHAEKETGEAHDKHASKNGEEDGDWTVEELKDYAAEHDIDLGSAKTKKAISAIIDEAEKEEE